MVGTPPPQCACGRVVSKAHEVIRVAQAAGEHACPGGGAAWYRVDGYDLQDQLRGVRGDRPVAAGRAAFAAAGAAFSAVLGAVADLPAALTALLAAVTPGARLLLNAKVL